MPKNVTISDDFDQPQGQFLNYDTYLADDRQKLYGQSHVDIRSFVDDEKWSVGTVARQADRNQWNGLSLSCNGGLTTESKSVIAFTTTKSIGTQFTNLFTNPSFEIGAAGWTSSGGTSRGASTGRAYSGGQSFKFTNILAGEISSGNIFITSGAVPVTPGQRIGARIYRYSPGAGSQRVSFYFNNGPQSEGDTFAPANTWSPTTHYTTVPAGATSVTVRFWHSQNLTAGQDMYLDAAQFAASSDPSFTLPAYFDGSTPGYRWVGAPNASASQGPFEIIPDTIDVLTNMKDTDNFSVALPAFPLASIDLTQSYIDVTSHANGDFTVGPTVSLSLDQSTVALVAGDSEYRRPRTALAGIDLQKITGVRFRIKATTTCTFRAMAMRVLGTTWLYAQHDIDTRQQVLRPTVAPNGSLTQPYAWTFPTIFRSSDLPNTGDPKPIDLSVAVAFNSGTRSKFNIINLFFRENALDFTQMIDIDGKKMYDLDGKPVPDLTNTSYKGRTQRELNRMQQDQLDENTQLELERTPDPDLSSYLTATISWQGTATRIQLQNSDTNGYTFSENIDGLAQNTSYVFIVDVEERTTRARLYPLDAAGNIVSTQLIYDTGMVFDTFVFVRRPGRFGWTTTLADGDAYIESIRTRRQVYAELQTQPFASITPVIGCELFSSFSPPFEFFEELFATDDPATTATVTRDQSRSTTGNSYRITNPGTDANQGVQTNLADFNDFSEVETSFDVYYPKSALDAGVKLKVFLSNDAGRIINLPIGSILPDRWQKIKIDIGNPIAQTGRYRLFIVQEQAGSASTWWVDNVHIRERTVSFYGRSALEDPWGDAKIDWVPFRNTLNKQSTGVQFIQRGNHMQVMAKAHRQSSRIDSIRAVPKYAQLGRLVWDEDELYNPQRPVASFTTVKTALVVTFNATASADPDGYIINYQWAFGDGQTATGPIVSHTYRRAGTYIASVIVTDSQGLQSQLSQTLFVTVT